MVELFRPPSWSTWVVATVGFTIFVDRVFIRETFGVIYSAIVGISWVAYFYFERLVFLFSNILILLVVIFDVIGVFLTMVFFIYALGGSILGWVVPFLRSDIDDRCIGRNVTDVYYLNFLIGIILNKIALLFVL